jgi:TrmH family RNA methyltransferase
MGDDIIRSRQNAHIKRLRALFARGARDEGQAAIEGEHLLQEALRSGIEVREIFLREDAAEKFSSLLGNLDSGVALHVVEADAFDSAGATDAPQGIAAIIAVPQRTLASALAAPNPLAAFLDGIQDPGNVGTIIRSA